MRDGKRVDLKLGNNSPETKSPLFVPDSPTQNDQEIVQLRHVLLDAMTRAGFAINPTEYWHFSYGDAMWAYMTQQTT
jgi:zinc D-Ala-D-Ala dipeptidase